MGEVWRARDRRLDRDVALKVLPEAFVADPERLARFEREAKVLASLNHPHIGGIYGLEEASADGGAVKALVLELVEGPTLAARIARGPIPMNEALPIARQIAEALEAAHEQGVIHRDLKPANIKIRPDGTVKVLDFGLAKALAPQLQAAGAANDAALSHSPTLTLAGAATEAGVILGTAAYMAPEQARGRPVDKRADIWAFGCVLYEMLTGRRAFAGADLSETLARVLEREPDWGALPSPTPAGLKRVLERCLRRDLDDRLHDIADARIEIEEADSATEVEATTSSRPWRRVRLGAAIVAALVVIASVGGGLVARWAGTGQTSKPLWFSINAPHGGLSPYSPPALSPDGRQIAFCAPDKSGAPMLWVRSFDSPLPRALPGTGFALSVFWSPDGRSLGFWDGKLKRVDLAGGSPQAIADSAPFSQTWGPDGDIVFIPPQPPQPGEAMFLRVSATGGPVTPVTHLSEERQEVGHFYPHFLPDGRRFLYFAASTDDRYTGLYAASLDGGEPTFIAPLQSRAEYADGHLIFGRGRDLFAQRFDLDTLKLTGEPSRIGEGVGFAVATFHNFSFTTAAGGVVAYQSDSWHRKSQLVLLDAGGRVVRNVGEPNYWHSVAASPDGKRLALERIDVDQKSGDVWIMDLPTARLERLTSFSGPMRGFGVPVWSRAGDRVLVTSFAGSFSIFSPDRSSDPEERLKVKMSAHGGWPNDWSPDGRYVIVGLSHDIWLVPTSSEGEPVPYARTPYSESGSRFSPAGDLLAYASTESGRREIYVDTFPQPSKKQRVSSSGGNYPRWSSNGRDLYYLQGLTTLMKASVSHDGDRLQVSDAEPLFTLPAGLPHVEPDRSHYDVLDNGEHFIFNLVVENQNFQDITVGLNWPESLKR
jgi:serine/threonine protein kinase/Tol biopolymer transport system component